MSLFDVPLVPLLLAAFLGFHGLRKRSLSPSGALAAFLAGFAMMAVPLRAFGVSLIIFYLAGSRATKVGKQLKAQLEDGHQEAGYRSAAQVLCNSASAFAASIAWSALFVPGSLVASVLGSALPPQAPYDLGAWCPLTPPQASGWSRPLLFVTLGCVLCAMRRAIITDDAVSQPFCVLSRRHARIRARHPLSFATETDHDAQACASGNQRRHVCHWNRCVTGRWTVHGAYAGGIALGGEQRLQSALVGRHRPACCLGDCSWWAWITGKWLHAMLYSRA